MRYSEAIDFTPDPLFASGAATPVRVIERTRVEWDMVCPHCESLIDEKALFYNQEARVYEHRQCGKAVKLPKHSMNEKKGCHCTAGQACDCWAFAPLYGDGKDGSLATLPYNNVIGKDGKAPDIPSDGTTRTTPAAGGGSAAKGGPTPAGAETGVGNAPGAGAGAGGGAGAVAASSDAELEDAAHPASSDPWYNAVGDLVGYFDKPGKVVMKNNENVSSGLDGLNDDLDFMARALDPGPKIVLPDDSDEDPNRNPMIMDDYYPVPEDPYAVDDAEDDPFGPFGDEVGPTSPTGCDSYVDLDMSDYYGDDTEVDPGDLLDAVLTLFKAAVG